MRIRMVVFSIIVLCLIGAACFAGTEAGEKQSEKQEAEKDRFFTITLVSPIGNVPREKAAQIIARDLEKIGIGVNLRYMEFASITPRWKLAAQTGATFDEGGYDMYLVSNAMNSVVDPSGIYLNYASDQFHPEGNNRTRYVNKEFDKLAYQALETVDDMKRWEIVRREVKLLYEDPPTLPLFRPSMFYGINRSIKFPEEKDPKEWSSYSFRWAEREIKGKTKDQMSLRERTLIYAQPSDIDAFLRGYTGSNYTWRGVIYQCYDAMSQMTSASYLRGPMEERGPKPSLAENWAVSEDGKIWTISLRKDVSWHDGKSFTADDVVFTFDLIVNPAAGYRGPSTFIDQNGITWEKLDDYTVRFSSQKFNPLFGSEILGVPILPKHLLESIPPEDLSRSEYNTGQKIVGTGPYIFEEYKPGEYIKYRANENYFGGRPWFDHLVVRIIPQPATAWYALKTGEVDITERWYGFTREIEEIKADPNLYSILENSFGPQMIRINHDHPILGNIWVIKAISLACNRQAMVDVISYGLGLVANQHLPPWSPGHNPDLPPLEYDLNEAKKMLIKAGYDYDTITIKGPTE